MITLYLSSLHPASNKIPNRPVSYTHLDVYKRQDHRLPESEGLPLHDAGLSDNSYQYPNYPEWVDSILAKHAYPRFNTSRNTASLKNLPKFSSVKRKVVTSLPSLVNAYSKNHQHGHNDHNGNPDHVRIYHTAKLSHFSASFPYCSLDMI